MATGDMPNEADITTAPVTAATPVEAALATQIAADQAALAVDEAAPIARIGYDQNTGAFH